MSLKDRLARRIAAEGPIGVAAFMQACLHDPDHGYYATRPALGEAGDFITAPMVSQMFGEMIGLWVIGAWRELGRPARFRLVEAGPGDGTLFGDMLNTIRQADPACLNAADPWLVETSAPLQRLQAARLESAGASWAKTLEDVPTGAPIVLVANELLDCMGADQFVRTQSGWAERRIGLGEDGELRFGLTPAPAPIDAETPEGAILELSGQQAAFGGRLGEILARERGLALLIDYGRAGLEFADTLQALKGHQKVDPLTTAGEADLTQHADFAAVAAAARAAGAKAWPVITQGDFLTRMDIQGRAAQLSALWPDKAAAVERQLQRLIAPDQMGALFKVLWLYHLDPAA